MDGKQIVLIMVLGCVSMNAYGAAGKIARLKAELKECRAQEMQITQTLGKKITERKNACRIRQTLALANSSLDAEHKEQAIEKERERYEQEVEADMLTLNKLSELIEQRMEDIVIQLYQLGSN